MRTNLNRPNVIIILSDDQGFGDLKCHGNPWLETPNLDELYNDSVRLTDFHTSPMCSPTRAALMSGKYPDSVGVWSTLHGRYIMREGEKTLGDIFRDSGYRTGMFGKWHLGDNYPYRPTDRGFDEVVTFGGGVIGETPDYWDNDYFDDFYSKNGELYDFDGYCTDIWFAEAQKFIEKYKDEPFCCYIATNAPHGPFNVDSKYTDKYRKKGVPDQRARFFGMIENIDENIGKLENKLREIGLTDNTILIFMGDNGTSVGVALDEEGYEVEGYNAGLRGKKCSPYEGGHKNACFIRWNKMGIRGGRDLNGLSLHMDILPTLADLCDMKSDPFLQFEGTSFAKELVASEQADRIIPDRAVIIHNMQLDTPEKYKDFTVMTNSWRLVHSRDNRNEKPELYEYPADSGQKCDAAGENPHVVEMLMAHYENWWEARTEQFDRYSPIHISAINESIKLTCHSWHGCTEKVYNQIHIRAGIEDNGHWILDVTKEGKYSIELRRWPRETDNPITGSIAPVSGKPFAHERPEGRAYGIRESRLEIQGKSYSKAVSSVDRSVTFHVKLESGITRLKTWFILDDQKSIGAYYAYIDYIES